MHSTLDTHLSFAFAFSFAALAGFATLAALAGFATLAALAAASFQSTT
jgi:hypothetical protein